MENFKSLASRWDSNQVLKKPTGTTHPSLTKLPQMSRSANFWKRPGQGGFFWVFDRYVKREFRRKAQKEGPTCSRNKNLMRFFCMSRNLKVIRWTRSINQRKTEVLKRGFLFSQMQTVEQWLRSECGQQYWLDLLFILHYPRIFRDTFQDE